MAEQFEIFTAGSRSVLTLAQEEALRLKHRHIGTEHLLLGLIREGDGVAARLLRRAGVELPRARETVEYIVGRGEGEIVEMGLTPRAKKVIELAIHEARRHGHGYIGTEHLLLALLREGGGIGAGALETLGVDLERLRRDVVRAIS